MTERRTLLACYLLAEGAAEPVSGHTRRNPAARETDVRPTRQHFLSRRRLTGRSRAAAVPSSADSGSERGRRGESSYRL